MSKFIILSILTIHFSFGQTITTHVYERSTLKSFAYYDDLAKYILPQEQELVVVNFWATWCQPCVEEIPYFNRMHKEQSNQKVRLIFVSLDFSKQINNRLIPFLNANDMAGEVIHLADARQNTWIDQVDEKWSGAIPATLFLTNNAKFLYEGELTFENLIKFVNDFKL